MDRNQSLVKRGKPRENFPSFFFLFPFCADWARRSEQKSTETASSGTPFPLPLPLSPFLPKNLLDDRVRRETMMIDDEIHKPSDKEWPFFFSLVASGSWD